jgi:hypothetical protein
MQALDAKRSLWSKVDGSERPVVGRPSRHAPFAIEISDRMGVEWPDLSVRTDVAREELCQEAQPLIQCGVGETFCEAAPFRPDDALQQFRAVAHL